MKEIVYIGNNLHSKNPTTLGLLTSLLREEGFKVTIYSDKQNKFTRLLDMCVGILKNRKANYVLIDTYSTVNFYFALVISQLARVLSIPYIPILHGGNLPQRLKKHPKLCHLLFNNALVNVAPSNYLLTAFKEAKFDTIFIPNAIEISKYTFKNSAITEPKLLWVRAFDEIYNPTMAIKVLAQLKKRYPKATLCMVGPDKDGSMEHCKLLATKLNVLDAIEFTGFLTKEAWIEKSQDFNVFINTTTIDNTPVSVIEAMALGLPVVSTDVGGLPYLITDQGTGFLVNNNDIEGMVNTIEQLIKNPDKTNEIIKNARQLVESFDVEIVKEQWAKLLK